MQDFFSIDEASQNEIMCVAENLKKIMLNLPMREFTKILVGTKMIKRQAEMMS